MNLKTILLFLTLAVPVFGATITGPIITSVGPSSRMTSIQFVPGNGWQQYQGTNAVSPDPVPAKLTNGNFAITISGSGPYMANFLPASSFVPGVLGWVPPDNGTYTFAQFLQGATNIVNYGTNPITFNLAAGQNVTLTTANGVTTISSTGGSGGNGVTHGTYTLSPTNAGVVTVDLNPAVTLLNNISGTATSASNLLGTVSAAQVTGAVNPTLQTNPPTYMNDPLITTNLAFLPKTAGGAFQMIATVSNATLLVTGDSMTAGQGGYLSASEQMCLMLKNLYGDSGGNCTIYPGHVDLGNWGNYPTQLNRWSSLALAGYWFSGSVGVVYAADGTNALQSNQGPLKDGYTAGKTYCTSVGVSYLTQPLGGNFVLQISSLNNATTNFSTLSGFSSTTNYGQINVVVPPGANDWRIYLTSLVGTNFFLSSNYLSTNAGVQVWLEAGGGQTLSNMLACGTNNLAAMYAAIKPNLIVNHSKDIAEVVGGVQLTNFLYQFFEYAPSNCMIATVGTPPIQTGSYTDQNFYYKLACQQNGWAYLPLWNDFQSWDKNNASGLMFDSTHPNNAGANAWGADLFQMFGFSPSPTAIDASLLYNQFPQGSIPQAVVTNGSAATLNSLVVSGANGLTTALFKVLNGGYWLGPEYLDSGQNGILGESVQGEVNIGASFNIVLGAERPGIFSGSPYFQNFAAVIVTNASTTIPALGISQPATATGDLLELYSGTSLVFGVNSNGVAFGTGSGLTGLNASQLASGTVANARLPAAVAISSLTLGTDGSQGSSPGTLYLGDADDRGRLIMQDSSGNQTVVIDGTSGTSYKFIGNGGGITNQGYARSLTSTNELWTPTVQADGNTNWSGVIINTPAATITGQLPALNASALTSLSAANVSGVWAAPVVTNFANSVTFSNLNVPNTTATLALLPSQVPNATQITNMITANASGGGSILATLVTNNASTPIVVTGAGVNSTISTNQITVTGAGVSTAIASNTVTTGSIIATNLANFYYIQTNFISGATYVNTNAFQERVSVGTRVVAGTSVGNVAGFMLWYDPAGGSAWKTNDDGTTISAIGTLAMTTPYKLNGVMPAGATFVFTNVSSGGTSTLISGTGQISIP